MRPQLKDRWNNLNSRLKKLSRKNIKKFQPITQINPITKTMETIWESFSSEKDGNTPSDLKGQQ
jgi:hypothetical protein